MRHRSLKAEHTGQAGMRGQACIRSEHPPLRDKASTQQSNELASLAIAALHCVSSCALTLLDECSSRREYGCTEQRRHGGGSHHSAHDGDRDELRGRYARGRKERRREKSGAACDTRGKRRKRGSPQWYVSRPESVAAGLHSRAGGEGKSRTGIDTSRAAT